MPTLTLSYQIIYPFFNVFLDITWSNRRCLVMTWLIQLGQFSFDLSLSNTIRFIWPFMVKFATWIWQQVNNMWHMTLFTWWHMEIIIHLGEATWQYHMPTSHSQFDHAKVIMWWHMALIGVTRGSQLSMTWCLLSLHFDCHIN